MKFTGVILNLDGMPDKSGDVFTHSSQIITDEPLIVTHDFQHDKPLGIAKLRREGKAIKYEIELNTETFPPELLGQLYPCVGGSIKKRRGKKISECIVTSIGLSANGNADPRIKRLNGKD